MGQILMFFNVLTLKACFDLKNTTIYNLLNKNKIFI